MRSNPKKRTVERLNALITVGFWGGKSVDPYDLLVSKARSGQLSKDMSVQIEKKGSRR